jgi:hypothetical protein
LRQSKLPFQARQSSLASVRTSGGRDTLHIGDREPAGPVSEFAKLDRALRDRDYQLATKARRQLRTFGYSVVPLNSPRKGGR